MIKFSKPDFDFSFDVIFVSGEYYDDHPFSGVGILARLLEDKGYTVGIIEKPVSDKDFTKLGEPKLAFLVSSGAIDSMLHNYTPLNKRREDDKHSKISKIPDRAILNYTNSIKKLFKNSKIIIGGIEASLRRFSHFDYWSNKIRRSIVLDSRADILVYGNGEIQILDILDRLKSGKNLYGIKGTCILSQELPEKIKLLPSFEDTKVSKDSFMQMQKSFTVYENLAQEYDNNYVIQFEYPKYTSDFLDYIYSLPFTRRLHKKSLLKMAKFSVVTHRGCIGNCSFCSIALHQGSKIISRSEENILNEIKAITKMKDFDGYIDDLGGPSANMYGMDCKINCSKDCIGCNVLDRSHNKILSLLKKARKIDGVKKIFVRSGIRFDLALNSRKYIEEISNNHLSGSLKIAPEHFSKKVLSLMNKDYGAFNKFVNIFNEINLGKNQSLKYYLMLGHPGETESSLNEMIEKASKLKNIESFQLFTPTPMSNSTAMYYCSKDLNGKDISVFRTFKEKKEIKRKFLKLLN